MKVIERSSKAIRPSNLIKLRTLTEPVHRLSMPKALPLRRVIFFAGLATLFVGLMISRAMISIGMIVLLANAVFTSDLNKRLRVFLHNKALICITLIFIVYLLSGLNSDNIDYFWQRMQLKLPFLAIPFAIGTEPRFRQKDFMVLLYFFVFLITASSFWVIVNYALNFSAITESLRHGKSIPVPYDHIRYSLMVALAVVSAIYLVIKPHFKIVSWQSKLMIGLAVFLFIFLHVLSVRSGLAVLYLCLFYLGLWFLIRMKRKRTGVVILIAIVLIPALAYAVIPSFHKKINYMAEDLTAYFTEGVTKDYSDSKRFVSIKLAIEAGKQSPLIGVGVGDVVDEMKKQYDTYFPGATIFGRMIPHNQYVYIYLATGLAGLLICLVGFLMPLFYKKYNRDIWFVCLNLIILFSFLVEASIEIQIGTAFYVLFISLGIRYQEALLASPLEDDTQSGDQ